MHENTVLLESFKKSLVFILMRNKQIYRMYIMLGHFPDQANKNLQAFSDVTDCTWTFSFASVVGAAAATADRQEIQHNQMRLLTSKRFPLLELCRLFAYHKNIAIWLQAIACCLRCIQRLSPSTIETALLSHEMETL